MPIKKLAATPSRRPGDYLWPAEFAALGFRFEQALGGRGPQQERFECRMVVDPMRIGKLLFRTHEPKESSPRRGKPKMYKKDCGGA